MTKRIFSVCAAALLAVSIVGCSNNKIDGRSVRRDMSPELRTTAATHEQQKNTQARAIDTTMRQIWDDLDKIFLVDQPSRLSRYPIP